MIQYDHVDVFSDKPFSGNGLTVFPHSEGLTTAAMQKITQEMRQFESIFLTAANTPETFHARIFTMEEELEFAGHPILGAACVLHEQQPADIPIGRWQLKLPAKTVQVTTIRQPYGYLATMDQGIPIVHDSLGANETGRFLQALNLTAADQADNLPLQVISTGLPYLIVPLKSGLSQARITHPDFQSLLAEVGARFVYVFDVVQYEGRTWDNNGQVEDIATGSAAGPLAVYLVRQGLESTGQAITISQGRFVGRPSQIQIQVEGATNDITAVLVSGAVSRVGAGVLQLPEGMFVPQ